MKFIADRTLGKLARKLRVLGFDTLYWRGGNLTGAVATALSERRVLLTRSRRLHEIPGDLRMIVVEANDPLAQIQEVVARLHLEPDAARLFCRCLLCNEELRPLGREEAEGKVPEFIYRAYEIFHICPRCGRIYWPGTHFDRMKKDLAGIQRNG